MGLRAILAGPQRGHVRSGRLAMLPAFLVRRTTRLATGDSWRLLSLATGLALLPLALVALLRVVLGIGVQDMTRDVAAIAHIHPLLGALSSVGILLWCSAASIWFFSASIHRKLRDFGAARFCVASGALSAYFAFDDLFQFHEYLAPTYLGLPEPGVYVLLAVVMAAYLWIFRRQWPRADAILLLLALCFLGGSVSIDVLLDRWLWRLDDWKYLIEDGLKWFGILSWLGFCVTRCRGGLLRLLRDGPDVAVARR